MKWSNLLSEERLGDPIVIEKYTEGKYPRSEFEKDYRRIISCASFRRLQDKTQVFPLDKSDFVRTRLTHSYETASIAKMLGVMVLSKIKTKTLDREDQIAIENIPDVLACAGLLHDIGNPPFGHFGEEIIKKWFSFNLKKYAIVQDGKNVPLNDILDENFQRDLASFDGNAQALRVLTKLHFQDSDFGLNLTSAVLNTLIKYPTSSGGVKKKKDAEYNLTCKKMGYFYSEAQAYKKITEITGAKNCRHPLALILEISDDIAYKTADIEDAMKKGLYNLSDLLTFIDKQRREVDKKFPKTDHSKMNELFNKLCQIKDDVTRNQSKFNKNISNIDLYVIQNWIPYAQEWLMYCAAYCFDRHYQAIMNGTFHQDLFYDTNHTHSAEILQDIMDNFIFPNREIIKLELAANTILSSLLDKFVPAVLFHDEKYKSNNFIEIQAYKKLYSLFSENYRDTYSIELRNFEIEMENLERWEMGPEEKRLAIQNQDIYLRLLLVSDYISGMTDSYAKSLYQELNGIYE